MARHRWATASRNRNVDRLDRILSGNAQVQQGVRQGAEREPDFTEQHVGEWYPVEEYLTDSVADDRRDSRGGESDAALNADVVDAAPLRARRRWVAARRGALLVSGCVLVVGIWVAAGVDRGDGLVVPVGTSAEVPGPVHGQDGSGEPPAPSAPSAGPPADAAGQAVTPADGPVAPRGEPDPASTDVAGTAMLVVHVAGAVASPGVIEIEAGARVFEVVELAGGALPEAELSGVNLAAAVQDGQQIVIPLKGEVVTPVTGTDESVLPPASGPIPADGGGLVNLNTAAASELEELPRVGPVLAERIIQWRSEHGAFSSPEDLDAVPGIGPAMLESLLPLVTV